MIQTLTLAASRFYFWHRYRLSLWLLLALMTLSLLLAVVTGSRTGAVPTGWHP